MIIPEEIKRICQTIASVQGEGFIAGGAVRDALMGREPHDFDIVAVGICEKKLEKAFPDGKWVGKSFPVMLVNGVEVALARTEHTTGPGHDNFQCFTFDVSLEDDLKRRDLTINAIAFNPLTGQYIDPYGGRVDIKNNVLRPVSKAFKEDPLRVFRVARFVSQLNMKCGTQFMSMCEDMRDDLLALSAERVFIEMVKAMSTNQPSRFFMTLDSMNVLDVWFPELAALKGREQPPQYHPEGDSFIHTMLVLDRARELGANDIEMFAALVHDLGKAVTDSTPPKYHHFNHEALGVPLVEQMCHRLHTPTTFLNLGRKTAKWHLNVHRFLEMRACKRVDLVSRLGRDLESVALASQADAQGRGPEYRDKPYPQRAALQEAHELYWTVRGDESMGDGPKVAEKLRQMRTKVFREHGMGK